MVDPWTKYKFQYLFNVYVYKQVLGISRVLVYYKKPSIHMQIKNKYCSEPVNKHAGVALVE